MLQAHDAMMGAGEAEALQSDGSSKDRTTPTCSCQSYGYDMGLYAHACQERQRFFRTSCQTHSSSHHLWGSHGHNGVCASPMYAMRG